MDLSNLSSNLPLSLSATDESINCINKELSDEFKIGARSIAALYRLSNSKNSLLIAKGYMDCINDIANYLENGSISSLADLNHFITAKRLELAGDDVPSAATTANRQTQQPTTPTVNGSLDNTFKFSVSHPSNHHFPKASTPLSIEHGNLKYYWGNPNSNAQNRNKKSNSSSKSKSSNITQTSSSSSDEEVIADDDYSIINSERGHDISSISNIHDPQYIKNFQNSMIKSQDSNDADYYDCDYDESDLTFDDANSTLKRRVIENTISSKKQKN